MNAKVNITNVDNTVGNIIRTVLILAIIVVAIACLYVVYANNIKSLIDVSGISRSTRFDIPLVDETDIQFARMVVPEETLDNVARSISDKKFISDPNSPIQKDVLLASSDRDYGTDLPWDRDVQPCEVLRNTDQDLYADVQDAKRIILY